VRHITLLLAWFLAFAAPAHADILIGVAGPMSGQNAVFGQQLKAGAEAAIADINAKGGINGETLILQIADDSCDARTAAAVALDFANRDVRMVAGHFCSGASLAASTIYNERKIVMISPAATLSKLTDGGQLYTFRLASRDDAQADVAVERIRADNSAARVGLVTDGSSLSRPLAARFKELMPSATVFQFKPGELDFIAVARDVKKQGINAIFFASAGGDAGSVVLALKRFNVDAKLYGSDELLNDAFWEKAGPAGEGMLVAFPVDQTAVAEAQSLVETLKADGKPFEGAAVATYAAIETYAFAAKAKSVNDARAIIDYLRSGTTFDTVVGKIGFDAKGDVRPQRFSWYRWSRASYALDTAGN
jgi:branched-chain amino acid transport system substrate-binding protein